MRITVRFTCGHTASVDPDKTASPVCRCGNTRIASTLNAPAPRFRGTVTGPYAETTRLEAIPVQLAERPLILKPDPLTQPVKES